MSRLTPFLVFLSVISGTATAGEDLAANIKKNCEIEWAGDYTMQKWCLDKQVAAANKIAELLEKNPNGTEGYRIIARCYSEWPGKSAGADFAMVLWCSERQFKAFGVTSSPAEGPVADIKSNCAAEWGDDYAMQNWCLEKQVSAANKIANLLEEYPEGTDGYNIIGRCYGEWPGKISAVDYAMVLWCTERQFKAYKALQ